MESSRDKPQSRMGVFGYAALVAVQILAVVFVLAVWLIDRGEHPEAIHGLLSAASLLAFWGSPIFTLVGAVSRQLRSDSVGRRAVKASLIGTIVMYLAIAAMLAWALVTS